MKSLLHLVAMILHFLQKGCFQMTIYQFHELLHPILLRIVEPKHTRKVTELKSIKFSRKRCLAKARGKKHLEETKKRQKDHIKDYRLN